MNAKSQLVSLFAISLIGAVLFGCAGTNTGGSAGNTMYDVASREYEQITEGYLQALANFDFERSFSYLADGVVFKMPDGDTDTRTAFKGLAAVKDFWLNYPQTSGNDKAVFKDFVHVPVQVNEMTDLIGATGVFNLCYFSAQLSYGSERADVRMHWAFHFDSDKKIDGIYTYYDRTPIIAAAKKNFLTTTSGQASSDDMVLQFIRIKSDLSQDQLLKTARERSENFKALPGLLQKYYVKLNEPGYYGGVYIWDSKASMQQFKGSELAATIPQAYEIIGMPNVEISEVLFQLR